MEKQQRINRNITGLESGRLTVLKFDRFEKTSGRKTDVYLQYWTCSCSCGSTCSKLSSSLISKATKSCGCLIKDLKTNNTPTNALPTGVAAWNRYYGEYIRSAKHRSLDFHLNIDEFKHLCINNCKYCGSKPSKLYPPTDQKDRSTNGKIIVNGIDRVDNSLSYTLINCVSCCKICNISKRDLTIDEWYIWIDNLVKFKLESIKC